MSSRLEEHRASTSARTMLDAGGLPVEELAVLAAREGKRPRPVYGAHKWFARRAGSAFRALLVAASLPPDGDFWAAYYGGGNLSGVDVLDPFVGGGTSVVEARRLGATVTGVDVDPVACAVTSFETRADTEADPVPVLTRLKNALGEDLARYYRTELPSGERREVLHFFWVQVVECEECGAETEAHPHFKLAYEAEGKTQWAFCSCCHEPCALPRSATRLDCESCGTETEIETGTVVRGTLTCGCCGRCERLIDVGERVAGPPRWRLFALESLPLDRPGAGRVPMTGRVFSAATDTDRALYEEAAHALKAVDDPWIERLNDRVTKDGRSDDRLVRYGYRRYRELFNERQLLHHSLLGTALRALPKHEREAPMLAFSDHLTTNCMLTCYAFGWRRLVPLFAVRAYRHVPRPVEINPWLDGVGRGTYPNALRQVARAIGAAKEPTELLLDGGAVAVPALMAAPATVVMGTAKDLPLTDESMDLVLTDPPYYDNIDYSELAEFYRPWVQALRLAKTGLAGASRKRSLAAHGRGTGNADLFAQDLGQAMTDIARVLRIDGRMVFTFRHNLAEGWDALGEALASSGALRCVQVFPLLAEGTNKLHTHVKSGVWDAVFVLERGQAPSRGDYEAAASSHSSAWVTRLQAASLPVPFGPQDGENFTAACRVAARLGCFESKADAETRHAVLAGS